MLTRLYASNFRCLLNFDMKFGSFGVGSGPNEAGKSSVSDVLRLIRDLASGDGVLGGDDPRDVPGLEFTAWQKDSVHRFEVDLTVGGHAFTCTVTRAAV